MISPPPLWTDLFSRAPREPPSYPQSTSLTAWYLRFNQRPTIDSCTVFLLVLTFNQTNSSPSLHQTLQQLFLCTFKQRTEGAGLIRETSCCCCGRLRWKPAGLLNLHSAGCRITRNAASGSEVQAGRLKVHASRFHLYQLFCRSNPPGRLLPATDPLQGAAERKGQTDREMSATMKPRCWTRQMLGQGILGWGWNTVTSDLGVLTTCQVSQSRTVSRSRGTTDALNSRGSTTRTGRETAPASDSTVHARMIQSQTYMFLNLSALKRVEGTSNISISYFSHTS